MAAKIIPFPRLEQQQLPFGQDGQTQAPRIFIVESKSEAHSGIHRVGTATREPQTLSAEAYRESQQEAIRIVGEVQEEWRERRRSSSAKVPAARASSFWATLPVPGPQRETPLTVARRLMHLLLSPAKTA